MNVQPRTLSGFMELLPRQQVLMESKNVKIPGVSGKSIIEFPGMVSGKILYNPMSVEKAMYKLSFKAFSKNSIGAKSGSK